MKLAIFGGTFNPPHFGHLFFANEVRQQLKLDKIIFVPTATPAHKEKYPNITDNDRLEMLRLALESYSWADVSDCDVIRGGITRTIDTIKDIKKIYGLDEKPGFILGDDLINGFHKWKSPDLIAESSNLILGNRLGGNNNFKYPHQSVSNRQFALSSSEIRDRVKKGLYIDFLLPPSVIKYIKDNGLYR